MVAAEGVSSISRVSDGLKWERWLALGAGVLAFVVWFVWWPYQHWTFEERVSVLSGWVKILMLGSNSEWQFCLVVPLIAGFLVYRQRATLGRVPVNGSWLGVPVLLASGVLFWLGYKVDTGYLGYAALQLSVAGIILLMGGKEWMRLLFVPWVFLVFAWPLFPLDTLLAAKLKIPTAWIAEKLLTVVGIGAVREGSAIQSLADFGAGIKQGERFTLDIADSCSGMRSLYALIMVAVLYSFMALNRTVPRILLSLSAIPLAVAGNVVRLLLLTVASLVMGQEWAVGKQVDGQQVDSFFHLLAGFMVFGVALAGMFGLATWLEGRHWKRVRLVEPKLEVKSGGVGDGMTKVLVNAGLLFASVGAALGLCAMTPEQPVLREAGFAPQLPEWVGGYHGEMKEMSYQERMNFDPTVTLLRRAYTAPGARPVTATIVISGEMKRTLHSPEVCMPNQGWTVNALQPVEVKLDNGMVINANVMRLFRDVEVAEGKKVRMRVLNLTWYQGSNGYSTPGYNISHFMNYRDAILFGYNHRWSQASFFMEVHATEVGVDDPLGEIIAIEELKDFAQTVASQFVKVPAS
ncbi:exosortase/archaeosortase family protein [Phragmitibacter flavus]|nr:exosortase/archaeosortase family protein [Phragmitibacter flavus]